MPRFHNINGERVQFTPEEEAQRDAEEAQWVTECTRNEILNNILTLEAKVTPRRLREACGGGDAGKSWLNDIESQIAIERAKLA